MPVLLEVGQLIRCYLALLVMSVPTKVNMVQPSVQTVVVVK